MKAKLCPPQIVCAMAILLIGFIVKVNVTILSQPPAEVSESIYVPVAERVCPLKTMLCPVHKSCDM